MNLRERINNITPSTTNINIKNILKFLGVLIAIITALFFLFSSGGKKEEKVQKQVDENAELMTSIQSELPSDYGANRKEKTAIETADEVLTEPEKEIPAEYFIEAQEPDPQPTPEELYEQELAMRRRDLEYQARTSPLKKSTKTSYATAGNGAYANTGTSSTGGSSNFDTSLLFAGLNEEEDPNMQKKKQEFFKDNAVNEFVLKQTLIPAISRYEVKTGHIIPVTMTIKVNSDNPGKVTATVRSDIYDSLTGTQKLIPMGSTLFGEFNSNVSFGQERLQMVFTRLTLPNGKSIDLGRMNAHDQEGQSGIKDQVDTHMSKVVASVVLSAILGAGSAVVSGDNSDDNSWEAGAGTGAGEQIMTVGNSYAEKVLNVQPTLVTRVGVRTTILVDKDIILEKYNKQIKYLNEN